MLGIFETKLLFRTDMQIKKSHKTVHFFTSNEHLKLVQLQNIFCYTIENS